MFILNNPWFAQRTGKTNGYPVAYRMVFCKIIFEAIKRKNNSEEIESKFQELLNAINGLENLQEDGFFDFFTIKDGLAFVFIDQTDGIYPLTIYTKKAKRSPYRRSRSYAFEKKVEEVIYFFDQIYNRLEQILLSDCEADWSKDIENSIYSDIFHKHDFDAGLTSIQPAPKALIPPNLNIEPFKEEERSRPKF